MTNSAGTGSTQGCCDYLRRSVVLCRPFIANGCNHMARALVTCSLLQIIYMQGFVSFFLSAFSKQNL